MLQGCVSYCTCDVFFVRVLGLFVWACRLVLRVLAFAFVYVCCKVAFHIAGVCRLRICFGFVFLFCLFVRVCCSCEWSYAFVVLCCNVAFHIACVCGLHVCFVRVLRLFVLCMYDCFVCACVCVCPCVLPCCVSYYMCVDCTRGLPSCFGFVCFC